ncbi:polysaccharide deacetylase family protein [Spiroplasma turonicum]|uniref:Putative chitin deacetylase n=1 Tax=Spiroplasma turonicum TaxID=216946 RepID=A0A0K1P8P8_9MOLU|nr:polysaccharide deacetylase family protein [Spiroplasma turonicum]AKU80272.1 putative chitin deacetylase [Spiroplasma turonicum]ALX71273.1 hypothetical protein STURO_v1c10220 [Spiroplasma turonicum]
MNLVKKTVLIIMGLLLISFFFFIISFSIFDKKKLVVNNIHSNSKVCMLTFDDGPSLDVDNKIMDILEQNNVEGTFFYIGRNIEENSQNVKTLFKRILDSGSYIGNHTYSHSKYQFNEGLLLEEIYKTNELILNNIENPDNYFIPIRLPYLQYFAGLEWVLEKLNQNYFVEGYLSGDWKYNTFGKEKLIKRYIKNVSEKNILIIHSFPKVINFLPDLILRLKSEGYAFATFNPNSKNYYKNYGELNI